MDYVSPKVVTFQKMIELRKGNNTISSADSIHFDDWKQRFKAFLYLTDVNHENAPFRYFPGSHTGKGWKLQRFFAEYNYWRYGKSGNYGCFSSDQIRTLLNKNIINEKIVTASAGTLILVDTRGLHAGTPLINGRRVMLANYFDVL